MKDDWEPIVWAPYHFCLDAFAWVLKQMTRSSQSFKADFAPYKFKIMDSRACCVCKTYGYGNAGKFGSRFIYFFFQILTKELILL